MMQSRWFPLAASVLVLCGGPARAATVLERTVQIEIRPDGSVLERERLRVRLDNDGDFSAWSPHVIYLDENRELESLSASVLRPDGKVEKVARRALDTHEVAGEGILHSSARYRSVSFPAAPVGSILSLDYEVKERPYFPAGFVSIGWPSSPTESLRVEVSGGVQGGAGVWTARSPAWR